MYCVAIDLWAHPGREADIEALFREYVPVVEAMPGTIRFEVHRDVADPSHFLLYELYESRDALIVHRGDELFKVWRPRIAELEARRTLVEYGTVVARAGPRKAPTSSFGPRSRAPAKRRKRNAA